MYKQIGKSIDVLEREKARREKFCFVRFWNNAGDDRKWSSIVRFSSERSADCFIRKYEFAGNVKQFLADIHGDKCPTLRTMPDRHEERIYLNGKCNLATFKWLFNAFLYRFLK